MHKKKKLFRKIGVIFATVGMLMASLPFNGFNPDQQNQKQESSQSTAHAFSLFADDKFATYYLSLTLDGADHGIRGNVVLDKHKYAGDSIKAYSEWKNTHLNMGNGANWGNAQGHINFDSLNSYLEDPSGLKYSGNEERYKSDFQAFLQSTPVGADSSQSQATGKKQDNKDNDFTDKNAYLAFSFPGDPQNHGGKDGRAPTQADLNKANAVSSGLVSDFNQAMALVYNNRDELFKNSSATISSGDLTPAEDALLALKTASLAGENSGPFKSIESNNAKNTQNLKYYVTVSGSVNGNSATTKLIYGQSKGYPDGDDFSKEGKILTWPMVAAEAVANWAQGGVTYDNAQDISKPSILQGAITDFFTNLINSIEGMLGIPPLQDMIFNVGTRSNQAGYQDGVAKKSWILATGAISAVFSAIAIFIIGFALAKNMYKYQWEIMSVSERISLVDDIKDMAITIVMLILYPWIFKALSMTNYLLVKSFSSLAGGVEAWRQMTQPIQSGLLGLGALVMMIVYLCINIYYFYFYTFRSIMLVVLNAVAPAYIASFSLGANYRRTFATWFKELIATLFEQAFQALIFAVFVQMTQLGNVSLLEDVFLLIAIIPLTAWFRRSLQADSSQSHALAVGAFMSTASAVQGAMGKDKNKDNGGGNNGGDGSDGQSGRDGQNGSGSNGAPGGDSGSPDDGTGGAGGAGSNGGQGESYSMPLGSQSASAQNAKRQQWAENNRNSSASPSNRGGVWSEIGRRAANKVGGMIPTDTPAGRAAHGAAHAVKSAVTAPSRAMNNVKGRVNQFSQGHPLTAGALGSVGRGAKGLAKGVAKGTAGAGLALAGTALQQPNLAKAGGKMLHSAVLPRHQNRNANMQGAGINGELTPAQQYQQEKGDTIPNTTDAQGNSITDSMPYDQAEQLKSQGDGAVDDAMNDVMNGDAEPALATALADKNDQLGNVQPTGRATGLNKEGQPIDAESFDKGDFARATGISSLSQGQDAQGNPETIATFNANSKGQFADTALRNSQYGKNLQDTRSAFSAAQSFVKKNGQGKLFQPGTNNLSQQALSSPELSGKNGQVFQNAVKSGITGFSTANAGQQLQMHMNNSRMGIQGMRNLQGSSGQMVMSRTVAGKAMGGAGASNNIAQQALSSATAGTESVGSSGVLGQVENVNSAPAQVRSAPQEQIAGGNTSENTMAIGDGSGNVLDTPVQTEQKSGEMPNQSQVPDDNSVPNVITDDHADDNSVSNVMTDNSTDNDSVQSVPSDDGSSSFMANETQSITDYQTDPLEQNNTVIDSELANAVNQTGAYSGGHIDG